MTDKADALYKRAISTDSDAEALACLRKLRKLDTPKPSGSDPGAGEGEHARAGYAYYKTSDVQYRIERNIHLAARCKELENRLRMFEAGATGLSREESEILKNEVLKARLAATRANLDLEQAQAAYGALEKRLKSSIGSGIRISMLNIGLVITLIIVLNF